MTAEKVAIYNLGCRVNQYEAEALENKFYQAGYEIVDFQEKADLYIINSCVVTTSAASKSRKVARQAKRRAGRQSLVVMAGCYSQVSPEEVAEIAEVDFYVATADKDRLVELVEEKKKAWQPDDRNDWQKARELGSSSSYSGLDKFPDFSLTRVNQTTRANLKIQDGCDQFCSYCIIPLARGRLRSKKPAAVRQEFQALLDSGIREFILTGIHLGAYGQNLAAEVDLSSLTAELLREPGNFRIRLSSLEAGEVDSRLLELMAETPRLCNHLHLPLQSGSNKILQAMNRPYTREKFLETIEKIKSRVPNIALTTDVIAGFPGETEQDFQKSLELIAGAGFSRLHVFPFSPRPGTAAAEMGDRVNSKIINRRVAEMQQLGEKLKKQYRRRFLNRPLIALLEEPDEEGNISGYTSNYIRIKAAEIKSQGIPENSSAGQPSILEESQFLQELANSFVRVAIESVSERDEQPARIVSRKVDLLDD